VHGLAGRYRSGDQCLLDPMQFVQLALQRGDTRQRPTPPQCVCRPAHKPVTSTVEFVETAEQSARAVFQGQVEAILSPQVPEPLAYDLPPIRPDWNAPRSTSCVAVENTAGQPSHRAAV
jgi:hypothetical protein